MATIEITVVVLRMTFTQTKCRLIAAYLARNNVEIIFYK